MILSRLFGFLSFVRLVGTVYFKKHLSSFKYSSPRALFDSYKSSDPISQHKQWLESIRYIYSLGMYRVRGSAPSIVGSTMEALVTLLLGSTFLEPSW